MRGGDLATGTRATKGRLANPRSVAAAGDDWPPRFYPFPPMFFGVASPVSPPWWWCGVRPTRLEVCEVTPWDSSGLAWHQLGNALWDVLAVVWWTLVAGCIALGGAWYMSQFVYADWSREHPPPHLRFLAERGVRRELARGLADLEAYLAEHDPTPIPDTPRPSGTSRPRRYHGWRRPSDRV